MGTPTYAILIHARLSAEGFFMDGPLAGLLTHSSSGAFPSDECGKWLCLSYLHLLNVNLFTAAGTVAGLHGIPFSFP